MKDFTLLVWLTQLALSVVLPLAGFILLAVWLRDRFGWGTWVLWAGIGLGVFSAVEGLIHSLKTMSRMSKDGGKEPPPVSFNDHD